MSKKIKINNLPIKQVHIQTVIFFAFYFIFSNSVFISLVTSRNLYVSYLGPFIFSIASSFACLYFFSHKDLFGFMGVLEEGGNNKEKGYMAKFLKYGKYLTCVLVSQAGGPIFLALTVRLLFLPSQNRYLVALISTLASTVFGVLLAKGLISFASLPF